jgi:hypothetical protein
VTPDNQPTNPIRSVIQGGAARSDLSRSRSNASLTRIKHRGDDPTARNGPDTATAVLHLHRGQSRLDEGGLRNPDGFAARPVVSGMDVVRRVQPAGAD